MASLAAFGHVKSRVALQSRDTFAVLESALRGASALLYMHASRCKLPRADNYLAICARDDALMDRSAERGRVPRVFLARSPFLARTDENVARRRIIPRQPTRAAT